jgi:Ribbon-helix-helix protein, copG family
MHRTQVYLTDEQRRRLARRAADDGTSQAEVIRRILDRELGILRGVDDDVAIVDATAGVLGDHPDWPEWLAQVRGPGSSERLRRLGL